MKAADKCSNVCVLRVSVCVGVCVCVLVCVYVSVYLSIYEYYNCCYAFRLPPYHNEHLCAGRSADNGQLLDRRYLLCPSSVTIGHLKKLIRLKFDLPPTYRVSEHNNMMMIIIIIIIIM